MKCPRCGKDGTVALVDGRDYHGPMFICSDKDCRPTERRRESAMRKISLAAQIEEIEREIELRIRVYPRLISKGEMRKSVADYHMERMRAVLHTLEWLQKNEARIKSD